ncbi:MAG: pectate lyase [Lachnospira sp.]|nr:pectate lyase [Lachnospira sp.]
MNLAKNSIGTKCQVLLLTLAMLVSVLIPTSLLTAKAATGSISLLSSQGDFEVAYATISPVNGASSYKAYVKKASQADSAYVQLDDELIRHYSNYIRVDALGLEAGDYVLKIEAVVGKTTKSVTTGTISVMAHDRSGFAFVDGDASGAYNSNGTLKSDAVVLYITEETKNTVSLDVVTSSKGATTKATGLQNILDAYKKGYDSRPLDIRLIGQITDFDVMMDGDILIKGSSSSKRLACGVTFEGVGEDATCDGWGLRIANASNVEVRNLGFMNCNSGEGDDVGLQQNDDHVWVHNCDFFYGDAGSDADQVKGDGALDTKTSSYITHSYNHFYDNGKCNLQGMKSESTENYITYHHNWYDHSDSRHPRIRTCTVHIYNNYYDGNAKYGVGATMGCSVFVENNYFRNCKYPMLSSMQGSDIANGTANATFSSENGGIIKSYGNTIVGGYGVITYQDNSTSFDVYEASSRNETVPSSVKTKQGSTTYNNFDTNSSLMYSYTVQSAEAAKNSVVKYAGRINGGDFSWTFTSEDDSSSAVNEALKAALKAYKTSLVSVGGNASGVSYEETSEETTNATENTTQTTTETTTETQTEATTSQPETTAPSSTASKLVLSANDLATGTYKNATTVDGFKLLANSSNSVVVESDTQNFKNIDFTRKIKLSGVGNNAYRSIAFNAAGETKVKIYAISDGSKKQTLALLDANGNTVATKNVSYEKLVSMTLTVPSDGVYYLASTTGAIDIYYVELSSGYAY